MELAQRSHDRKLKNRKSYIHFIPESILWKLMQTKSSPGVVFVNELIQSPSESCLHGDTVVSIIMRLCVSVGVTVAALPAVRGRGPVHLSRHCSDIFDVTAALTVVQRAAACVSGLICVALRVIDSDATLMCVCKHVDALLFGFIPFPV